MSSVDRKILVLTLAAVLSLTALAGCAKKASSSSSAGKGATTTTATSTATSSTAGSTKTATTKKAAAGSSAAMGSSSGHAIGDTTIAPTPAAGAKALAAKVAQGRGLVSSRCTAGCHQLSDITSRQMSAVQWNKTVSSMIKKGAKLNSSEQAAVVEYLSSL